MMPRTPILAILALAPLPAVAADTVVNASLVLKVAQVEPAADTIVARAEEAGGWFSSRTNDRVVLRVPTESTETFVTGVEALGIVVDRSFQSEDRSLQLADLRSRAAARRQMLAQYMDLLKTAEQDAILTVEREIVSLVAEIEGYEGRIRFLEDRIAFSEIAVDFRFQDRTAPVNDGSSSFAWLNTVNLSDLLDDFQTPKGSTRARRVRPEAPDGFARYPKDKAFRAASPDDVLFRVRTERHEPDADLAFWKEALLKRMTDAGYRKLEEKDVVAGSTPGYLLQLTAPLGVDDALYVVAVFPVGRRLVVVEAAGEVSRVRARMDAILAAIAALDS
ncbi:MAG: DUF4349 domain-containing protein [Deltaproteobacteria bacterium]|nr:DUF4349 domain-containing protein [Deltaproteobacteria bacterium]